MNIQKGGKLFVKILLALLLLAYPPLPEANSENEELMVRRVLSFCRDEEYVYAKKQIETYLETFPDGPCRNHFHAMRGDIGISEKKYTEALAHYNHITSLAMKTCVQTKRWRALYRLERYAELYEEMQVVHLNEGDFEGLFYLAEATYHLGKEEEALPLYETLLHAEFFGTEDDEAILLRIATVLASWHPEKAATLFASVAQRSSPRAGEAALGWLQLLAEKGDGEQLEAKRELWFSKIPSNHLSLVYYHLGMVAFEKEQYGRARLDLERAIEGKIAPPHDRSALHALLVSAKEENNLLSFEAHFPLLKERYPEEVPEAKYLQAAILHDMGAYEEARIAALASLENEETIRLLVDLSTHLAEETADFAPLVADLERAFALHLYPKGEKEAQLAHAYLETGQIHAALGLLHEMERPDPRLFTIAYVKEGNSPHKVIAFGEKAVQNDPTLRCHLLDAYCAIEDEMLHAVEHSDSLAALIASDTLKGVYRRYAEARLYHLQTVLIQDENEKRAMECMVRALLTSLSKEVLTPCLAEKVTEALDAL